MKPKQWHFPKNTIKVTKSTAKKTELLHDNFITAYTF